MTTEPEDILVSFGVVSLFTKVPSKEAIHLIERKHFVPEHIISLSRHCMNSTYFMYENQFYKQKLGTPMGSPLSPVVGNLFMEDFETRALESAPLKPRCWLRYVDDTFVIWQHGLEKLQQFLDHINGIHNNIQFTMETEENGRLPFLDVLVYKKPEGGLGHTVHRKNTHTDRYLNALSHHHPSQIKSVANTLADRSRKIADSDNIDAETRVIKEALLKNGFPNRIIHQALHRKPNPKHSAEKEDPVSVAFLPYVKGTTDRISKLLARKNIKTIFNTDMKIEHLLRNYKDKVNLEGKGVYEIPCSDCSKTYIGQTGHNIETRKQEHETDIRNKSSTSSLVSHITNTGHKINFSEMRCLISMEHVKPRETREAIEIEKRPHNMNKRNDSKRISATWKPILSTITVKPREPTKNSQPKPITHVCPSMTVNRRVTRSQAKNLPPTTIGPVCPSVTSGANRRVTRSQTQYKSQTTT